MAVLRARMFVKPGGSFSRQLGLAGSLALPWGLHSCPNEDCLDSQG